MIWQGKMQPHFNKLKGRILSIYAISDTIAGSCVKVFSWSAGGLADTEITLESDAGHKLFFIPRDIWLEPIIKWIKDVQK